MAKASMKAREKKREKLANDVAKQAQREQLKADIRNPDLDFEQKEKAKNELNKRKRDESPSRVKKRCVQCGRPRGVYKKFKLCRCCFRKQAMDGHMPGIKKASW